jgi:hypothetical protein
MAVNRFKRVNKLTGYSGSCDGKLIRRRVASSDDDYDDLVVMEGGLMEGRGIVRSGCGGLARLGQEPVQSTGTVQT